VTRNEVGRQRDLGVTWWLAENDALKFAVIKRLFLGNI